MSRIPRFGASARRVAARLGRPVTLTRGYLLSDLSGTRVTAFELGADASSGATSVTIRRPASARFRGELPPGIAITIGGTGYTSKGVAQASANQLVVTLVSGLEAVASTGDAVTLAQTASFQYQGIERDVRVAEVQRGAELGERMMALTGTTAPILGDTETTTGRKVTTVMERPGSWLVRLGAIS